MVYRKLGDEWTDIPGTTDEFHAMFSDEFLSKEEPAISEERFHNGRIMIYKDKYWGVNLSCSYPCNILNGIKDVLYDESKNENYEEGKPNYSGEIWCKSLGENNVGIVRDYSKDGKPMRDIFEFKWAAFKWRRVLKTNE